MYQQQQQKQSVLTEEDLAGGILSDLKRIVREYATAATESTCPDIRQLFTKLTDNTLALQGQMFQAMQQANMYNTASPALRQELDKQAKQYQQTKQKTNQFLQQTLGGQQSQTLYTPQMQQSSQQQQNGQTHYM
ncbi:spore coat protein CotF [Paenibacillus endophyticus]|uniref:Spore coat protein CotF n=1 Tax=Paenibacillus endophyticus TaxID=1294268 RepID=A0A7W5C2F9_9BACL|nr:spore coat protein [Paenibacillus endophyticus]MBB3150002.1 spore coat protein CotF [Paenibacillus endophyticus]